MMSPMFWYVAIAIAAGLLGAWLAVLWKSREKVPTRVETVVREATDSSFALLVEALPLGVMFIDSHAKVRFANQAAGTIFGFDVAKSRGNHVLASIPNVELERRIADALRGEASVALMTHATAGMRKTYGVSVYPLNEEDAKYGVVVFADDQTALISLERARKEFLSNVSHELRTPLSSIKLMLETVVESPDDEAADLFLPQVLAQVDRLAALVGQLLEQARAESGQLKLQLKDVDLEEVAHPIVASFEPQAMNKGVR